jgi:hypothetical protein
MEEESMYVSSKLATGRWLAVVLAVTLVFFGMAVQTRAQELCCPVDPKAQHEAEKDAAKAAEKARKEAEHAQHEAAEDCERAQKKLADAREEVEEQREELAEAQAELDELSGGYMCPSKAADTFVEPQIERSKPEPVPEAAPTPEPTPEPAVEPIPEPPPPPVAPAPAPTEPTPAPKELPNTSSPMSLLGLIGLVSMSGYLTRFFRR